MTLSSRAHRLRQVALVPASALLFLSAHSLYAQNPTAQNPTVKPHSPVKTDASDHKSSSPDRAAAYYHYGLAHLYEDLAVNAGRSDYATQAVEEYKLALSADPDSTFVQNGLADLYFKIGRIREAVTAAQEQINRNPNDIDAHTLLGKIYLRSLGDMQSTQSGQMLELAITEYEKLAELKPNDIEIRLLLGQLYGFSHDSAKAEQEFKIAQKIDANSEEVALNMARLYSEQGESQRAADTLSAVPVGDRTSRIEYALGISYDQLHKTRDAIGAYRRAIDLDPDNMDAQRGLASALLTDGQLDEALKALNSIVAAEPQDALSQIHIAEIQRRQGHYELALETLKAAKALAPDSLELTYNEALVYDSLGRYDEAVTVLAKLVESSAHADGKYSDPERVNRSIFLDRLGIIYKEQNKTTDAIAVYKQVVDLGGEYVKSGYQGQIDAYRDAHMWKEATAVATQAAKTFPKDRQVQLMYASQLADTGHVEQGTALANSQLSSAAASPEDREVYLGLAQIYIRTREFKAAAEKLDKAAALTTRPDDKLYVVFLRGTLYDRQKLYDQAEAEFRKALAIDPNNAMVLNYLGYMLADRGEKLPEALTLIRKAVDLDPQNGAYLDSLGWAYYKSGQYALAEENLRKANERINTDPTVHDHLGEVYEKTGKLKMAVAQWERSMTEYASSLPADADPVDVSKVQRKLENARVKLAKVNPTPSK
jgi:tetratricopeptide (TPR) repeat protein